MEEPYGKFNCPPPSFDGTNYATWKKRMEEYLLSLDYYLLRSVTHRQLTQSDCVNFACLNARAKVVLTNALSKGELAKVGTCQSAKDTWDTLHDIYGNTEVTKVRLELLGSQFDTFTMKPEETISDMYSRFMEIVTEMFDLGRVLTDCEQVHKILSILPSKFEEEMAAMKEERDVRVLKPAVLIGLLISCEDKFKVPKGESSIPDITEGLSNISVNDKEKEVKTEGVKSDRIPRRSSRINKANPSNKT